MTLDHGDHACLFSSNSIVPLNVHCGPAYSSSFPQVLPFQGSSLWLSDFICSCGSNIPGTRWLMSSSWCLARPRIRFSPLKDTSLVDVVYSCNMSSLHHSTVEKCNNTNKCRRDVVCLIIASMSLSILAFIPSVIDLGKASFFLVPVVAGFSIVYHITIIVLCELHISSDIPPCSKKPAIAVACLLALLWMAAFGVTLASTVSFTGPRWDRHPPTTWIIQLASAAVESGVMWVLVIVTSHARHRRDYGGSWLEF